MSKILVRIGFMLGLLDLVLYAISTYTFHKEIEVYRWIITAFITLILGIYTWKQKNVKK